MYDINAVYITMSLFEIVPPPRKFNAEDIEEKIINGERENLHPLAKGLVATYGDNLDYIKTLKRDLGDDELMRMYYSGTFISRYPGRLKRQ